MKQAGISLPTSGGASHRGGRGQMKRNRRVAGCLLAVALFATPLVANAQKGKKPPAPPAAGAAAGAAAPAAPAGTDTIEVDDPNAPKEPKPAEPAAPAGTDPAAGGGGICEIDPSACPKQSDIKSLSEKKVNAEVYAVEQEFALKKGRFELNPYGAFTLNDQFVSHPAFGLTVNYWLTNVLAIGINGNLFAGLNVDSDFNFQNRRATRVAVPLTEYQWSAAAQFTYVPIYGKFSGFNAFIFNYDVYALGGVGALSTRPIPVIDPDNRKFSFSPKIDFNVGLGLRIAFNKWFAATLELRDHIYIEQLENINVPRTQAEQTNEANWLGDKPLTNHIQAQLGVSVFLPFGFEYRLPR
jgi:outer membrane beta-barrel protein